MTDTAPPNLSMPAKPQIVAEAVARLDTLGMRSSVLSVDTQTLTDLGMRLTDRNLTVRDAAKWLNQELGGTDAEPVVPERNVYRFAENFRTVYGQVRSEHARRIARLNLEHATDGNTSMMARVATQRLVDLVTERLVETDNLEELNGTQLSAAIATIDGIARNQIKQAELALKAAEGDRKAQKLEADLAKMQADIQHRQADTRRRVEALTRRIDSLQNNIKQGRKVDASIFNAIRDELVAMATPEVSVAGGGA